LVDGEGHVWALLGLTNGRPEFCLYHAGGKKVVGLACNKGGGGTVWVYGLDETQAVMLGGGGNRGGAVFVFGPDGAIETSLPRPAPPTLPQPTTPDVIESRIDGEFEGWDGDTVFKLANGQIWEQASYAYTYHYAYRPEVIIFLTAGGYKMKVEGVTDTIYVRRLK